MKRQKSDGADGEPAEAYKVIRKRVTENITDIFNHIQKGSEIRKKWKEWAATNIYRGKENAHDCSNYRPIFLLIIYAIRHNLKNMGRRTSLPATNLSAENMSPK